MSTYLALKFAHLLAFVYWLGGLLSLPPWACTCCDPAQGFRKLIRPPTRTPGTPTTTVPRSH